MIIQYVTSILILCCLVLQIYSNVSIRKVVSTKLGDIQYKSCLIQLYLHAPLSLSLKKWQTATSATGEN